MGPASIAAVCPDSADSFDSRQRLADNRTKPTPAAATTCAGVPGSTGQEGTVLPA